MMLRAGFAGLILGLVMLSTGCRMCAHPFDYCGPTFTGDGPCCVDEPRAGSILAGGAVPVPEPTPATDPNEIDYRMPGSGDVSFLDSRAEQPALAVPAVAEIEQSPAIEPSSTASETPGWTTSRRTAARPLTGPRLSNMAR